MFGIREAWNIDWSFGKIDFVWVGGCWAFRLAAFVVWVCRSLDFLVSGVLGLWTFESFEF